MKVDEAGSGRETPVDIEEVIVALRGSATLEMLGVTTEDLARARIDSDLLETLRISHEFLIALRDASVLDAFLHLPSDDRSNFLRWVASTYDREARASRTRSMVMALKESPLGQLAGSDASDVAEVSSSEDATVSQIVP